MGLPIDKESGLQSIASRGVGYQAFEWCRTRGFEARGYFPQTALQITAYAASISIDWVQSASIYP